MHGTERAKNVLAPLVLRLALAGIFIYHGLDKIIGRECDGGANWLLMLWDQQGKPPRGLEEKVQQEYKGNPEQAKDISERLKAAYETGAPQLPESLRAHALQLVVAWGELLGGIAIFLGILTRLAALGEIAIQIGAVATVTWGHGFSFAHGGGYEYNFALIAMCLALAILGPGPLAVQNLRRRRTAAPVHQQVPAASAPV